MTERFWYPKFLIDEVLPQGLTSPEDWLPFLLTSKTSDGRNIFTPGEVVDFKFSEYRGCIELTIQPNGTHSTTERCPETSDMFGEPKPPANAFWEYESEIFATSLNSFASQYAELDFDEPQTVVSATYWSDAFRYRISDDGKSLILQTPPADAGAQETSAC